MIGKAAFAGARAHLALPLMAGALVAACQREAEPAANAASAVPAPAAPTPAELAQRLVREHVGAAQDVRFAEALVFDSGGATIVCGRFAQAGQAEQRFITVGNQDVFVESRMEPGHMDQAVTEFCRKP